LQIISSERNTTDREHQLLEMAFEDSKKRKAPETLLEFSDYIMPISYKKQKTWHSESLTDADGTIIPPFYTVGELMGFNFDFPELPLDEESPSGSSYEEDASVGEEGSPSVDSPDASAIKKRKKGRPVKYQVYPSDFDITVVLQDARFLDEDNSCPNKTIIRAIKYTMDNKAILQRNVSSLIGVSPSTLSLYMNETNRQNGWRTFEKKAFAWLRKVWDVRPIEQVADSPSYPTEFPEDVFSM
jgi:hypothetical protein